ncbi:hypothetical protein H0E87_007302 [Populus deltoides]|uniref:Uncharacterized protein n=1 Tax=Populus deltoides TaxID=3696 RepID=A0A8T2ZAP0_POPDE|nr:hypothetical protein H0E87_007302 [Populus deltoides]
MVQRKHVYDIKQLILTRDGGSCSQHVFHYMIHQHEMLDQDHDQDWNNSRKLQPQAPRLPYAWLKSTTHDLDIKDKYPGLIGKRGKNMKHLCPEDFGYDPRNYSHNFEDDFCREDELRSIIIVGEDFLPHERLVVLLQAIELNFQKQKN